MSAAELLADLHRRGVGIEAHGDRLRVFGKAKPAPELLATLRKHKGELLALLSGEPVPPTCRRCSSLEMLDVPIHDGRSVRRDCALCGRFVEFAVWYGRSLN